MSWNLPPGCKLSDLPDSCGHLTACEHHEDNDPDGLAECTCEAIDEADREAARELAAEI